MSAPPWQALIVAAAVSCGATWLLTLLVRRWLLRAAVLDQPNERSSHATATPRGAGLAIVAVLLIVWAALSRSADWPVLALAGALAALSWLDDLRGLSPLIRLVGQAAAVLVGLATLDPAPVFQGLLPPLADRALAALAWLWFVNLYNFMDGVDGITGVQTACIGLGITLVASTTAHALAAFHGAALAGAALGFLLWNWRPARIFLGDVGSVTLGYLVGWLLLGLAARGHWAAALLLPMYYLADASWTLTRRLLRGDRVWQAHRSHFYQRAAPRPEDHPRVAGLIGALGIALVACATWSLAAPLPALATGGALTLLLLWWFGRVTPV